MCKKTMNLNSIFEKLSLGFYRGGRDHLPDAWYRIFSQKKAQYPRHYFGGRPPAVLHPQLIFDRNHFSKDLSIFFKKPDPENFSLLPFVVGKTETGLVPMDFAKDITHLLISGITGAGKTSAVYSILFSLMWLNLPDWLKISVFATKGFGFFDEICNVYQTPEEFQKGAEELLGRMSERMAALKKEKNKYTISLFNAGKTSNFLKYEIVVMDEFANILRALEKEKREEFAKKIAQVVSQGRSLGIHFLIMPQRPDVEGVPSSIKSQLVSSLTFRLKTEIDARTAGCLESPELRIGEAILKCPMGRGKLKMLEMRPSWPPFFAHRIQKTMLKNEYSNCFK